MSNGENSSFLLLIFILNVFLSNIYPQYRNEDNSRQSELCLGPSERASFVNVVLKLIDRGQYSKNEHLSETVAAATSLLSYIEPSLVLPFLASRFHMALETVSNAHVLAYMIETRILLFAFLFFHTDRYGPT